MAAVTETCGQCSKDSAFVLPDDTEGVSVAWECPECGAKNWTAGDPPHVIALADAAMTDADVVSVVDGDTGQSSDVQG